jgi:hypothetical protein
MVTTASTHIESSDEKMSKTMLVGGAVAAMVAGGVIGYIVATAKIPDCCTILPAGTQGYKSGSSCLPLTAGKVCRAVE